MNEYISLMGETLRMSRTNYKRYLRAVIAGDVNANPLDYGAVYLYTPTNVTDISADWARMLLEMVTERKDG